MTDKKIFRFIPLIVALSIAIGVGIGSFFAYHFSGNRLNILNSSDKLNSLFHIIEDQYVDTVNLHNIVEGAIPEILKKLDPHSVYIPAEEVEQSMQELKGSFSGIGVQFMIYRDTVRIVRVIEGGPSESVGLKAGDRIVSIDGKNYIGPKIDSDETRKRLKGKSGSTIKLGIIRSGVRGIKNYNIVRGDVPVESIDATYMLNKNTGYVRINNFGETTYDEFLAALATLNDKGMQNIIIDLRGNLGGYMTPAIQIANEFLPKDRLIVYTLGRKSPREEYNSDGSGTYQSMPLVILVDEISASASEILAGAIQDNDRGMVIGRRTFGKGLVQIPIEFSDGSMIRLTKARYYTPAGRCLQKPYSPGDEEMYEQDLILRAEHGEYYSSDSIKTSGTKYRTRIGRIVYGGGGIIPDVFIPRDTTGLNSYFKEAYLSGLINEFAYAFTDKYRKQLSSFKSMQETVRYLDKQNVVEQFATYADENGLKRRNLMLKEAHSLFREHIFTNIIQNTLGTNAATQFANSADAAIIKAQTLFNTNKAFPTKSH